MSKIYEKQEARRLRSLGQSIPKIAILLGVSKGSVSLWVKDLPQPLEFTTEYRRKKVETREAQLETLRKIRREAQLNARIISGDGYWMIRAPLGYKGKTYIGNRYVYEHRYLMEQKLGRLLTFNETVHHKDHNKLDNADNNLELKSRSQHSKDHGLERPINILRIKCPSCNIIFERPKRLVYGNQLVFCSRKCIGKFKFRKLTETKKSQARKANIIEEYSRVADR